MMIDTHILNFISSQYLNLQCDHSADPCDMFDMLEYEPCRLGIHDCTCVSSPLCIYHRSGDCIPG
jgi:hypothetical protein